MSPGGADHSFSSSNIYFLLAAWARRTKRGRALTNEVGLITQRRPDTVRGADVVYFSYERLSRRSRVRGFFDVAPELVVEVLGRHQNWKIAVEKAGEYFAMGVNRVWIVDPARRTLHVLSPDAAPQRFTKGQSLRDEALLPGFSCRVAELFDDS